MRPWRCLVPEPLPATYPTLEETAARNGAYCWVEHRLFALTGARSADPGLPPALRVLLFQASAQHAAHAARWFDRLPVLATMDREALVRPYGPALGPLVAFLGDDGPLPDDGPPSGGGPLPGDGPLPGGGPEGAAAADPRAGFRFVAGLYRVALPHLLASYRAHAARLSPVADEPSRQTAADVVRAEEAELAAAGPVLAEAVSTGTMLAGIVEEAADALGALVAAALAPAGARDEGGVAGAGQAPGDLLPWSDGRCAW